jgi:hypothetical protein
MLRAAALADVPDELGTDQAPDRDLAPLSHGRGLERHGMAGFYQKMLKLEDGVATLTDNGVAKLERLNELAGVK